MCFAMSFFAQGGFFVSHKIQSILPRKIRKD